MSGRKPGAKPDAFRLLMSQSNTFVNHYTVIYVSNTATQEAIKKLFKRKLSTFQHGKVPEDVLAGVLTQAHLSRLKHAHDVLLDEDKRTELNMCHVGETKKPKEETNPVDSYPVEPAFNIFGAAMHVVPVQPPPKGKWCAVRPRDPLWDIWAKMGIELRSVQAATVYVALLIYRLDEREAKDNYIPGGRRNDEQPRSTSDYWKAQSHCRG